MDKLPSIYRVHLKTQASFSEWFVLLGSMYVQVSAKGAKELKWLNSPLSIEST
jgi:hypothetical protein